jgi:hypothetical protein
LPEWKSRENPRDFSQVWDVEIDEKDEDIWFTDEKQNAIWRYIKSSNIFEMYVVPGKSKDLVQLIQYSLNLILQQIKLFKN